MAFVCIAFVVGIGVAAYAVGHSKAADKTQAGVAEDDAFEEGYARSFATSRARARLKGARAGHRSGSRQGARAGESAGSSTGGDAAETELARIAEQQAAEDAALADEAAAAAEAAIPAPCADLPPSTARNMCIAAVAAGTYP